MQILPQAPEINKLADENPVFGIAIPEPSSELIPTRRKGDRMCLIVHRPAGLVTD